ncbi:NADPH2:quinone reductase [Rhodobium orientis]|uniref:NAD(P)H-quinone oxidoreductase n=1 Tax=Rhodobium orientis TaxID=34017 RepID=A0A327JS53_9HYPH|nr:NAD(P)H-quinone oxidoreductase [Rhodobium orientis]MBB4302979.1 NADPH2:quinone reductase [Rhodobium orientis]MBK5949540.1 NAD(P)H-quinone oxidoreductase [Rhodobium orientis]RAI29330.1 NAD(P)H-quinone oxidoreductase [Rhodobium orientis]
MTDTIPETMTAIAIQDPGGPEVLVPEQRQVPHAYEHEILVKVAAAGINRPDVLQRQGLYPPPKGASDIPGLEIAGTVAAVGRNVARWKVGDTVTALVPGGGYAEYCAVNEATALPVPDGLSMAEAASLPETFFTVWSNVFDRGRLQKGEVFLIHGGTSGIGTTAIQMAKAFGARVIATAGSDDKCAACKKLGADEAINYQTTDYVEAVKAASDGHGADVILDMVGGDYIERNYKAAAVEGRIVQIAFLNGPTADVDFRRLMMKRLTHTGSTLRAREVPFKAEIAKALEEKVWPLIASGSIKPVIDSTFDLKDASKAHERMETSGHIGKIVLTTGA